MDAFIGCDPGANGAICVLILPEGAQPLIYFLDHAKSKTVDRFNFLSDASTELNVKMAILEEVHSLFGMSAKSNFTFGGEFRLAKAMLELQSFGFELVQPRTWQKAVGIPNKKKGEKRTTGDLKKLVHAQALQLYPHAELNGPKGAILDGRSDALMIAHYARLRYATS